MAKDYCVCFSSLQRPNLTPERYLDLKESVCRVGKSLLRTAEPDLNARSTTVGPPGLLLTVTLGSQTRSKKVSYKPSKGGEQRPRQRASAMRQEVGSGGRVNEGAGTSGRDSEG